MASICFIIAAIGLACAIAVISNGAATVQAVMLLAVPVLFTVAGFMLAMASEKTKTDSAD